MCQEIYSGIPSNIRIWCVKNIFFLFWQTKFLKSSFFTIRVNLKIVSTAPIVDLHEMGLSRLFHAYPVSESLDILL
jgi:hypothetical protein